MLYFIDELVHFIEYWRTSMTDDVDLDQLRLLSSTNTQTRRLGYLVQTCKMLNGKYLTLSELQKRIEDWADENNDALEKHISDKGILRRSSRSLGARRYIALAQSLELITNVSGFFRPTKTGRVILALNGELSREDNPFELGLKTASLLCYQLLLLDADYLLPTLELTTSYHQQSELLKHAQKRLLNRFSTLENYISSPILRSAVHDRFLTISRWTKPVKYLEHLLLPRLHWLLDLKLLEWDAFRKYQVFTPNQSGYHLLHRIPLIDEHHVVNRNWCQNRFFSVFAEGLGLALSPWSKLSQDRQQQLITEYVSIGFDIFRTMEYPRISAYQLILFIIIDLLDKGIGAGFEEIKQSLDYFSRRTHIRWSFFWSAIDDDGYLLLSQ
ncbi:MAG: hypothetical protein D6732_14430 [Methanobacteriota archaeon]|nr:MAG: hypothetical protein D6732_14430 [Euryarchaeota archaeon]